jgi:hypothetical protein
VRYHSYGSDSEGEAGPIVFFVCSGTQGFVSTVEQQFYFEYRFGLVFRIRDFVVYHSLLRSRSCPRFCVSLCPTFTNAQRY